MRAVAMAPLHDRRRALGRVAGQGKRGAAQVVHHDHYRAEQDRGGGPRPNACPREGVGDAETRRDVTTMVHLKDENLIEIFTAFVDAEINPSPTLLTALANASERTVADLKTQFRAIYRSIEVFDVHDF
jgi:hypothetical protein